MRITRIATALLATAAAGMFLAGCSGSATQTSPTTVFTMPSNAGSPAPTTQAEDSSVPVVPTVHPTTPSSTPVPTVQAPAALGVSLTYHQSGLYAGTGTATVWTATWTQTNPASYIDTPATNGAFLVLDVSVQGVSGSLHTNPNDFTLKDALGHSYSYEWSGQAPIYDMATLPAGEIARGFLTFDVPQGPMSLTMGSPTGGDAAVRWAIPAA